jgi:hypothetical protein
MAAKAEVSYDPSQILPNQIANHISDLGFPCEVIDDYNSGQGEVVLHVSLRQCDSI